MDRGVDQQRGPDLHRPRPGEQELDRVLAVAMPPTPITGTFGSARATWYTAASASRLIAGSESPPTGVAVRVRRR